MRRKNKRICFLLKEDRQVVAFMPDKVTSSWSNRVSFWIKILGTLLTLVALAFVIQRLWVVGRSNWQALWNTRMLLLIALAGLGHGLNCILQGLAWQKLLVWFGETAAKPMKCLAIYGRSQIAKYIPGNVFHFAGRHVLGNQSGFHHPALVGAMFYEIIGMLLAAVSISLLGFPVGVDFEASLVLRLVLLPMIICLPLVVQFVIARFSLWRKWGFPEKPAWRGFLELLPIWGMYLLFFIIDGFTLWVILGFTSVSPGGMPMLYVFSGFTISWVVGFITPGAPAGLGVRDALMILVFTSFIGPAAAAWVTLISRLVVTLGDIVFFLFAWILTGKKPELSQS